MAGGISLPTQYRRTAGWRRQAATPSRTSCRACSRNSRCSRRQRCHLPSTRGRVSLPRVPTIGGLAPCGRVLPCQLRRRSLESFLLPLEPSFPGPRTLQVVSHVQAQPAQPLRLQLDQVALLEGAEPAVVRSGGKDIAGLQGVDRADPFDAPRNPVGHVARGEVLLERSVHPEPYLEFVRIGHLIGGHETGADRSEGVTRLHLV